LRLSSRRAAPAASLACNSGLTRTTNLPE
jgi:hypothetical protein